MTASPSPDLVALRRRYVPPRVCSWCRHVGTTQCPHVGGLLSSSGVCDRFRWNISLDQFATAGQEVSKLRDYAEQVTGELVEFGWSELLAESRRDGREWRWGGDPVRTRSQWAELCASLFGVSASYVRRIWKAGRTELEPPEDMSAWQWYEILSCSDDPEEQEALCQAALAGGWNTHEIQTAKRLRNDGLVDGYELPPIIVRDGAFMIEMGGRRVVVAELTAADPRCTAVFLAMLARGHRVVIKTD